MGPPPPTDRDEGDGFINLSYDEDWLAAQLERRRKRNLSQHESTPPPRFWLRRDDDAGKAVPLLPGRGRVGSPYSPQGGHMEHGDECMRERERGRTST